MNNLSSSFKKFLGNKNTVTILGVVICIIILYIGYSYRIKQQVELISVPYATQSIASGTQITGDMISTMEVPTTFIQGEYYKTKENIINKYVNYNYSLSKGSLFYTEALVNEEELINATFKDVPKGHRVTNISLDDKIAAGLIGRPGDYVDIYFSALTSDNKVMFGEFIKNVEILAVLDENGNSVYGTTTEETGAPSQLVIAVPEELFLLIGRLDRLNTVLPYLNAKLVYTPNLEITETKEKIDIYLTSDDIRTLINENAKEIDKIEENMSEEETETQ